MSLPVSLPRCSGFAPRLGRLAGPAAPMTVVWLGNVRPVRQRKLYFTERPSDPNNPNSLTVFMITVEGQEPAPYDPRAPSPNIVVKQGDVEDWVIENRTRELHAFHIHQIHFLLREWNGVPVDEPFLRDTVNVDYWDGTSTAYPNVKLRMDFCDPNTVGTFVYHCHLLEHEDGGMMGTIRVEPASAAEASRAKPRDRSQNLYIGLTDPRVRTAGSPFPVKSGSRVAVVVDGGLSGLLLGCFNPFVAVQGR